MGREVLDAMNVPHSPPDSASVILHLRRITIEDAFVAVPATASIMKPDPEPDGTYRVDFKAFVCEAVRLSRSPHVDWRIEQVTTEPHPVQCPAPDDRRVFEGHREGRVDSTPVGGERTRLALTPPAPEPDQLLTPTPETHTTADCSLLGSDQTQPRENGTAPMRKPDT